MPIFVSAEEIAAAFPEDTAQALLAIKTECEGRAVTPALALSQIKRYLLPLAAPLCRQPIVEIKKASWRSLLFLYPKLVFMEKRHGDRRIAEIAEAARLVVRNSATPPRDFKFTAFIEVADFLLMHDHLKTPLREACGANSNGECWLYRFCRYCWRRTIGGTSMCPEHSTAGDRSVAAMRAYKEAFRQRDHFDIQINRLVTREGIQFHDGNRDRRVIWDEADPMRWAAVRRPRVVRELRLHTSESCTYEAIAEAFIADLHNCHSASESTRSEYALVNAEFRRNPILLWPLLLRAEAWFQVREEQRAGWGGRRRAAGSSPSLSE